MIEGAGFGCEFGEESVLSGVEVEEGEVVKARVSVSNSSSELKSPRRKVTRTRRRALVTRLRTRIHRRSFRGFLVSGEGVMREGS